MMVRVRGSYDEGKEGVREWEDDVMEGRKG